MGADEEHLQRRGAIACLQNLVAQIALRFCNDGTLRLDWPGDLDSLRPLLDPVGGLVPAVLVQDQPGGASVRTWLERDLRADDFVEESPL